MREFLTRGSAKRQNWIFALFMFAAIPVGLFTAALSLLALDMLIRQLGLTH